MKNWVGLYVSKPFKTRKRNIFVFILIELDRD